MKNTSILFSTLLVILVSCQREPDFIDPTNQRPNNGAGLLTRMVFDEGTDSTVFEFSYTPAGKLLQFSTNTSTIIETQRIIRDAKGMIKQIVRSYKDLGTLHEDSSITSYFYDPATLHYTYSRRDQAGIPTYLDSVAYTYDGSGNIASFTNYRRTPSSAYMANDRGENSYTGGNLMTQNYYSYDPVTAGLKLSATMTYTHDTKTNPLLLKEEAMLLGLQGFEGPNNVLSEKYVDANAGANNYTRTVSLIYNANNLPVTGSFSGWLAQPPVIARYYYK